MHTPSLGCPVRLGRPRKLDAGAPAGDAGLLMWHLQGSRLQCSLPTTCSAGFANMGSGRDKRKKVKGKVPGKGAEKTAKKTEKNSEKSSRRIERKAAVSTWHDMHAATVLERIEGQAKVLPVLQYY